MGVAAPIIGVLVTSFVIPQIQISVGEWNGRRAVRQERREIERQEEQQTQQKPIKMKSADELFVQSLVDRAQPHLNSTPLAKCVTDAALFFRWLEHKLENHDRQRIYETVSNPLKDILLNQSAQTIYNHLQANPQAEQEFMKLESPQIIALAVMDRAMGPGSCPLRPLAMKLVDQAFTIAELTVQTNTCADQVNDNLQQRRMARETFELEAMRLTKKLVFRRVLQQQ